MTGLFSEVGSWSFNSPFGQFLGKESFTIATVIFKLFKHAKLCWHMGERDALRCRKITSRIFYCCSEGTRHTTELWVNNWVSPFQELKKIISTQIKDRNFNLRDVYSDITRGIHILCLKILNLHNDPWLLIYGILFFSYLDLIFHSLQSPHSAQLINTWPCELKSRTFESICLCHFL